MTTELHPLIEKIFIKFEVKQALKNKILLVLVIISSIIFAGCNSVKTDYTNKLVIADANLLGVDLQTGFDPVTGTPLPKLQMGEIDLTYISIPLNTAKNSAITLENRTNNIWGGNNYLQRKITVKIIDTNNTQSK